MRTRLPLVWCAVLVVSGVGCSGGGADGPGESGPSATPPVGTTPDSDAQAAIEVPSKLRAIQGRPLRASVKVTRTGTPAPVELSLSGLPAGVTSQPVTAAANQNEIELAIEASSSSVQGTRADVVVTAKTGDKTTNATFKLHITGAPGTPDLSFGDKGVVHVQPPGLESASKVEVSALAVQDDGQAVVVYNWNTVTRFDAKGALDVNFGRSGRIDPSVLDLGCRAGFRPCLFLEPDSKILLVDQDFSRARRFWNDGGVDLTLGTNGSLTWSSSNDWGGRWLAGRVFVDGEAHFLSAGTRYESGKPFIERVGPKGALDPRFDATAALACSTTSPTEPCRYPLAFGSRSDGTVLYATYAGIDGTGKSDVRLTELSNTGTKRFTSPVLFATEWGRDTYRPRPVFILPDVGGSTVVVGFDEALKLTAAKVSPTGEKEVARRLDIEPASFPQCTNFGIFPTGTDRLTVFCTVDQPREVRLLRLTHALDPDESFGPGGLVVGDAKGTGAHVAVGPEDTLVVAAEKKLLRIWN